MAEDQKMKTVLVTGSTDGIGLETAKALYSKGHHVLMHGRNFAKLEEKANEITPSNGNGRIDACVADLSKISEVEALAASVAEKYPNLDVLINNAGLLSPGPDTPDGLDVRFAVNTIAPYLLTKRLGPLIGSSGRVVNVASMSQSPVDLDALANKTKVPDEYDAYCQCKLALISWTRSMASAQKDGDEWPAIVAVNPGSLLRTKMVTSQGVDDCQDVSVAVDILCRAALSDEFKDASGMYYDNDNKKFADPHPDALNATKCDEIVRVIEAVLDGIK